MAHDAEAYRLRDGWKRWLARCNTCGWWRVAAGKFHAEELAQKHIEDYK